VAFEVFFFGFGATAVFAFAINPSVVGWIISYSARGSFSTIQV